ncbi:MAG: cysteine synthase A [Elusimicrobia bacterium]|nr:cysteine synthase A [Elusimicrobiota bacterium]MDD7502007.1 cysteine synthase A [Elusimicrobiota bacterium]MDY5729360.1 cysteine synthase A [Elusimicrobiaceae bacterium]
MKLTNLEQAIGHTPILELKKLNTTATHLWAKLEMFNPFSVKDRAALFMLNAAEKEGRLAPGGTIVEPTSGNTGIALAFLAAARGYKMILTMPESMSAERVKLVKALGAQIVLTPKAEGMQGAVSAAVKIVNETPGAFMPGQFNNPNNPLAHEKTTGPEIWEDLNGRVDIFVAGVGTGGTISGVGQFLKRHNPTVKIVAVEPAESPLLSAGKAGPHGIQGIGANFVPANLDKTVIDEIIPVKTAEAQKMARLAGKLEGVLPGVSGGAALWAALEVGKRPENKGKYIVALLPDSGERYLSTGLFD